MERRVCGGVRVGPTCGTKEAVKKAPQRTRVTTDEAMRAFVPWVS